MRTLRSLLFGGPAAVIRPLLAGIAVGIVVLISAVGDGLADLRARMLDELQPRGSLSRDLVVVGIDEGAVAAGSNIFTGQGDADLFVGPLQLDFHALLIEELAAAGARAVVYTYTFPPQAGTRIRFVERAVQDAGNVLIPRDLRSTEVLDGELVGFLWPIRAFDDDLYRAVPVQTHGALGSSALGDAYRTIPLLLDTESYDFDGGVERSQLPALALGATVLADADEPTFAVSSHRIRTGARVVPVTGDHELMINYTPALHHGAYDGGAVELSAATRRGMPYISAGDVLEGRFEPAAVRDKVVIIGDLTPTTARVAIPNGPEGGAPELYVHANALNTILTGQFLSPISDAALTYWIMALVAAAGLLAATLPIGIAMLGVAGLVGAYGWLLVDRFDAGLVMDPLHPPAAIVAGAAAAFAVRHAMEARRRRRVSMLFAQYVPAAVAQRLMDEGRAEGAAAGERLEVSVLFCDLRGFTSVAAALPPGDVRDLLNIYYRHAARVILARRGTVMQYVGDEVFAVFGAPLPRPDHADAAVACAQELQLAASTIADDLDDLGIGPISFGIGVHTGDVVAAHVGDQIRRQYAVVGDAVNVGARLCGIAGPGEIVVSDAVRRRLVDPPEVQSLGPVALKGVDRDVGIHRLVGSTA